jgi:hypothetical protein
MSEEYVTKSILKWLISNGWEIVAFDYPGSGTGKALQKDDDNSKNKNAIIPDVVAIKNNIACFFENKDRFFLNDFLKQNSLILNNLYSQSISNLLKNYHIDFIYYGIGLPVNKYSVKANACSEMVDFIIGVNANGTIEVLKGMER